jgi:hypothetical protein
MIEATVSSMLQAILICLSLPDAGTLKCHCFTAFLKHSAYHNLTAINFQKSTSVQLFLSILNHSYIFLCSTLHCIFQKICMFITVIKCQNKAQVCTLFSILTLFFCVTINSSAGNPKLRN